jgi:hypothetical protein
MSGEPSSSAGIYRKLAVRMWSDAKVLALSRPEPCGQVLWIHLLVGEQTDVIPGLYRIGELAFAEQLGWSLKDFRRVFLEVFRQGLVKADWTARVIWVPNAIKYNLPRSPNVVTSWKAAWDRIPECPLKIEAWTLLSETLKTYGESFGKSFVKSCPMSSPLSLAIQDQEQEQEQNQEKDPPTPKGGESVEDDPFFAKFWQAYPRKVGKPKAAAAFAKLRVNDSLFETILAALAAWTACEQWTKDAGKFIPHPTTWLSRRGWEDELPKSVGPTRRPHFETQDERLMREIGLDVPGGAS